MLKLRRLTINKFRNVAFGEPVLFDDGVNVVLGRNGTGKSTLLALISAICRFDFKEYEREPLNIQAVFETPSLVLELMSDGASEWRYRLVRGQAEVEGSSKETRAIVGALDLRHAPITPFAPSLLGRVAQAFLSLPLQFDGLQHAAAFRFDEALETFTALTSGGIAGAIAYPGSVAPPVEIEVIRGFGPVNRVGRDFVPPRLAQAAAAFSSDDVGEDPRVPLPKAWCELLGYNEIQWRPELLESRAVESLPPEPQNSIWRQWARVGKFKFRAVRKDGHFDNHERLSYGQKRMLTLLYYLDTNPAILIADELVNGLHHEWIDKIVGMLGGRQAFLTSQNPLLFDFLKIESAEQVERMFVMCESSEDERGSVTLKWRNMTADEARSFYEELEVGADFVSEVLLRRGLW